MAPFDRRAFVYGGLAFCLAAVLSFVVAAVAVATLSLVTSVRHATLAFLTVVAVVLLTIATSTRLSLVWVGVVMSYKALVDLSWGVVFLGIANLASIVLFVGVGVQAFTLTNYMTVMGALFGVLVALYNLYQL